MQWTTEQEAAITSRRQNLLVGRRDDAFGAHRSAIGVAGVGANFNDSCVLPANHSPIFLPFGFGRGLSSGRRAGVGARAAGSLGADAV